VAGNRLAARGSGNGRLRLLAVALSAAGCLGPLDTLGYEDDVTENQDLQGKLQLADDQIADKHPTFDRRGRSPKRSTAGVTSRSTTARP
jgi:hypothetical protein